MKRKIMINGIVFEVTEEGYKKYKEYERERLRNKYLRKLDKENGLASLEYLVALGGKGAVEPYDMIEEEVIKKLMLERMAIALDRLTKDELYLIKQIYLLNVSQEELGKQLHITQQAISKKLKKVLEKLRMYMEE